MPISVSRIRTFADGLDHPECVTVHPRDGSVWAGGEAGQIYRITSNGKRVDEVMRVDGGFILGLAFAHDASWLAACDLRNHCVWRIDPTRGRAKLFSDSVPGHKLFIPNYVTFNRQGDLFLSESGTPKKRNGKLLRYDANGRGSVWHRGPFDFANGLAMPSNEQSLYVVESFLPGVSRIEIRPDGSPGKRQAVVRLPQTIPDGIAFDAHDRLLVTCYTPARIYRISHKGVVKILAEDWQTHALAFPTNIAFADRDKTRLLIANLGRWHLSVIDLRVSVSPRRLEETA